MHKPERTKGKRNRSTNFTPHETNILLCLVEQYSSILENKTTNAATWQRKKNCWERIAEEFCCQSLSNRTASSLREKYENMKKQTKAMLQANKNGMLILGDVGPLSGMTSTDERIAAIMGASSYDFDNEIDSNAMLGTVPKNDTVPEQSQHFEYLCGIEDVNVKAEISEEDENGDGNDNDNREGTETVPANKTDNQPYWSPKVLKRKKPAKLKARKLCTQTRSDELLYKQTLFYENENRRAEERHQLQIKKLNLKIDLLNIEKTMKTLQMNEMEKLNKNSNEI